MGGYIRGPLGSLSCLLVVNGSITIYILLRLRGFRYRYKFIVVYCVFKLSSTFQHGRWNTLIIFRLNKIMYLFLLHQIVPWKIDKSQDNNNTQHVSLKHLLAPNITTLDFKIPFFTLSPPKKLSMEGNTFQ